MSRAGFQEALGYHFSSPALLAQALTHRSFGTPHNERLEFIGDSVLNCVVARALFDRFPELDEGTLSRLRAGLVKQDALHAHALSLSLGDLLRLGEGELRSGGHRRPSILADALEAVFGAIFLDAGFDAASGVIDRLYAESIAAIDPRTAGKDPKTALQEWLQARRHPLPNYEMAQVRGEAHAQEFEVSCRIPALMLETKGRGASRRAAEQQAARAALDRIEKL
ncbi:ribonuclease III [Niveibacterium microcysteis]|uniref:Ribonuclease 3 n=1 Tax=Niveibacterium microcysteis TaxID=2811415 RepID=A0ABX7M5M9_9RHOO|nr:ribonuclease III [Niveibacterium microcysteis]QSI75760.1 ribonuclease III [Niveibacterium microcysteis]